jgi:hypothetical protein
MSRPLGWTAARWVPPRSRLGHPSCQLWWLARLVRVSGAWGSALASSSWPVAASRLAAGNPSWCLWPAWSRRLAGRSQLSWVMPVATSSPAGSSASSLVVHETGRVAAAGGRPARPCAACRRSRSAGQAARPPVRQRSPPPPAPCQGGPRRCGPARSRTPRPPAGSRCRPAQRESRHAPRPAAPIPPARRQWAGRSPATRDAGPGRRRTVPARWRPAAAAGSLRPGARQQAVAIGAGPRWSRASRGTRGGLADDGSGSCQQPARLARPGPPRRPRPAPGQTSRPASAPAAAPHSHAVHVTATAPVISWFPVPGSWTWQLDARTWRHGTGQLDALGPWAPLCVKSLGVRAAGERVRR